MNILLLTTRLNLGGIGVYVTSLAKALKERGENVFVASSGGEFTDQLQGYNIEHINLAIDTSADIGFHLLPAYIELSMLIKKEDIHIIHANTRVTQVIACILAKRNKIPYISTCHGFFKKRLFRRLFPCWGEHVIAISDAVKKHLTDDFNIPKDKISLIYNGVDIRRFERVYTEQEKIAIRKNYGLTDAPTIGIIARLSEVKGHKYLFGAVSKLILKSKDVQLLVIGDGPASYLKELKALVQQLDIADNAIFHKGCQDTAIPLSIMDVFCMPSIEEGLGFSILEAMAMGVPVVASSVGGIPSLIKDKENGILVPPKNEDILADSILQVLDNKGMAERMGKVSKEIVRQNFTVDAMADKILKVYRLMR